MALPQAQTPDEFLQQINDLKEDRLCIVQRRECEAGDILEC